MTQPSRPRSRWDAVRDTVGRPFRGGLPGGPRLWLGVVAGIVAVLALGTWVTALATPVEREGRPTASVTPLPAPTTATPTPSGTPTASASAAPSPSAQPSKMKSSAEFDVATAEEAPISTSGELRRYSVRAETTTKLKADKVAKQIAGVLNDPRSWTGSGGIRFELVGDPKKADFTITLGAPGTAAKLCKPDASGTCVDTSDVVINAALWTSTPEPYAGNQADWQAYLVNHGVGRLLGEKPATCPKQAKPAPVMMAQSGDLDGCTANPWPYP